MTKYYVDTDGKYLGGFEGCEPPENSVEVSAAPDHASQAWNFQDNSWNAIPNNILVRQQIMSLELLQTDRRIREAALGIDNGWLQNLNNQIETLRQQLT
jgi:hypothetical protein